MEEKKNHRKIFYAKTKKIDINIGNQPVVLLNEREAVKQGIRVIDDVGIRFRDQETHEYREVFINASFTNDLVRPGTIWILQDAYEKYHIPLDKIVGVFYEPTDNTSVDAIKKSLVGKRLQEDEISAIISDIAKWRLSDTMITYYISSWFLYSWSKKELFWLTKASADTWEKFTWDEKIVLDKHCIWWVPGNETTLIIVPIISSLGITIPKTFSKSITSPAATGECAEVLMDSEMTHDEIIETVKQTKACLACLVPMQIAPANKKLAELAYPISMEPYSKMVSSIMAIKYAMWITHCLIDIPLWPTAKVTTHKDAKEMKEWFIYLGKKLGMKVHVEITPADEPIGNGIGAALQVREVLRVLQQHKARPKDLEKKAIYLASKMLEIIWYAKGKKAIEIVKWQLTSWKAREQLQKIIIAQKWKNPNIQSEEVEIGKITYDYLAEKKWIILWVDMKYVWSLARMLWCPLSVKSWFYLHKKLGDKVEKWDILYTIYSVEKERVDRVKSKLEEKSIYEIE